MNIQLYSLTALNFVSDIFTQRMSGVLAVEQLLKDEWLIEFELHAVSVLVGRLIYTARRCSFSLSLVN